MRSLDLELDLVLNQVEGTSSGDRHDVAGSQGAPGVINELIGASTLPLYVFLSVR